MPPIPAKKKKEQQEGTRKKEQKEGMRVEEVVKTPFKGDTEDHKCMAMDYLVEKYTKERVQLCFLGWDHVDEEGFHYFKVVYNMGVVYETPVCEGSTEEMCMSCSS